MRCWPPSSARRRASSAGPLKIFFGMAPGVGKTYAMLQAAQEARRGGRRCRGRLCGDARPRRDRDAAGQAGGAAAAGRTVEYRGATLQEMDLDAILARAPQLGAGGRTGPHQRPRGAPPQAATRTCWNCSAPGIDVYTTVNVQHFESRADAVRQITGVTVLRDGAGLRCSTWPTTIELIDLPPERPAQAAGRGQGLHAGTRRGGRRTISSVWATSPRCARWRCA
jgi:two-component system sensor histidine kinase KdpD